MYNNLINYVAFTLTITRWFVYWNNSIENLWLIWRTNTKYDSNNIEFISLYTIYPWLFLSRLIRVSTLKLYSAEVTAQLFFDTLSSCEAFPRALSVIATWDLQEPFKLGHFKLLESSLSISLSYHPWIDGQTEKYNNMFEEFLRSHYNNTSNQGRR